MPVRIRKRRIVLNADLIQHFFRRIAEHHHEQPVPFVLVLVYVLDDKIVNTVALASDGEPTGRALRIGNVKTTSNIADLVVANSYIRDLAGNTNAALGGWCQDD